MKKRTYQSKKINQIDWEKVKKNINGERIVFAIDVAKTDNANSIKYVIRSERPDGLVAPI